MARSHNIELRLKYIFLGCKTKKLYSNTNISNKCSFRNPPYLTPSGHSAWPQPPQGQCSSQPCHIPLSEGTVSQLESHRRGLPGGSTRLLAQMSPFPFLWQCLCRSSEGPCHMAQSWEENEGQSWKKLWRERAIITIIIIIIIIIYIIICLCVSNNDDR